MSYFFFEIYDVYSHQSTQLQENYLKRVNQVMKEEKVL